MANETPVRVDVKTGTNPLKGQARRRPKVKGSVVEDGDPKGSPKRLLSQSGAFSGLISSVKPDS